MIFHRGLRLGITSVVLSGSFCLRLIAADTALVQRKTNLRKDPSAKHPPIEVLLPGDELTVLDSGSSQSYLKVRAGDHKIGWVWRKSVDIVAAPVAGPSNPVPTQPPGSAGGPISPDWPKPDPVDETFEGSEGPCGGTGDGGDAATNARKNRTDPLPQAHDVDWNTINSLPYPAAPASRASWTKAQLAAIAPYEGVAVRTIGYLSHTVNVENTGSGESTNCHFHADGDVDWHIYLQQNPTDGMDKAVIVETTPRIRSLHHWDPAVLDKWVGSSGKPVRITGFLMLDPEHRNQVGQYRGTVWEIHPITNIEVCNTTSCGDSDWVALDQVNH